MADVSPVPPPPAEVKARPKGPYNCGKCGQPKRGHKCTGSRSVQDGEPEAAPELAPPQQTPTTNQVTTDAPAPTVPEPMQADKPAADAPEPMTVDQGSAEHSVSATPAPNESTNGEPSSATPAPPSTGRKRGRPPKKKRIVGQKKAGEATTPADATATPQGTSAPAATPVEGENAASAPNTGDATSSGKKIYLCGMCGQPKRGHTCSVRPPSPRPPTQLAEEDDTRGRLRARRARQQLIESNSSEEDVPEEEESEDDGVVVAETSKEAPAKAGDATKDAAKEDNSKAGAAEQTEKSSTPRRSRGRPRKYPVADDATNATEPNAPQGGEEGTVSATSTPAKEKKIYMCSICGQPKRGHKCTGGSGGKDDDSANYEAKDEGGESDSSVDAKQLEEEEADEPVEEGDYEESDDASTKKKKRGKKRKNKAPAGPSFGRTQIGDLLNLPSAWHIRCPIDRSILPPPPPPASLPIYPSWTPSSAPPVANSSEYYPIERTSVALGVDGAAAAPLALFASRKCKRGAVFNVGGPAWAVDWLEADGLDAQYIAVAPLQSSGETHRIGRRYEGKNMVQVWRVALNDSGEVMSSVACGIAHNGAYVVDLRWCPHSSIPSSPPPAASASSLSSSSSSSSSSRLGLLAASLGDGRVVVWSVPFPTTRASSASSVASFPVWSFKPVLEFTAPSSSTFTCVRWAPASAQCAVLLTGRTDGAVQLWNVRLAHDSNSALVSPFFDSRRHTDAVRAATFRTSVTLTDLQFISTGNDGAIFAWDVQQPYRPLCVYRLSVPIVDAVWFNEDSCVIAPEEPGVGVITTTNDEEAAFWSAHNAAVTRVDVTPVNELFASAGRDGSLLLHDTERVTRCMQVATAGGSYTLRTDVKETAKTESVEKGKRVFPPPAIAVTSVRWNPNGNAKGWLVAGTALGIVCVLRCGETS